MNAIRRLGEGIAFVLTIWFVGLLLGPPLVYFRMRGKIRFRGLERLAPHKGRGMLIVSNHPSLIETVLLPFMFFPACLVRPFRLVPWSTPDRANIMAQWYTRIFRHGRMIMIDREPGTKARNAGALRKMLGALANRESVVLFAEGGRTHKRPERTVSPKGNELGKFSKSIEFILRNARCVVVPVWVKGAAAVLPPGNFIPDFSGGKEIEIRVGRPIEDVISAEALERTLLALADEP